MKKYLAIFFALFLVTLPGCFKKEIKKNTTNLAQSIKNEENLDITIERAFNDDIIPCYGWELDQENITNAD